MLWTHAVPIDRLNGGQMPRLLAILVPLIFLVLAALACGGKGGGGSPTVGETATLVSDTTPEPGTPPTPADNKMPSAEGTPVTPSERIPSDEAEYEKVACEFDAGSDVLNCGEHGRYLPNPTPPEGSDCGVLLEEGVPVFVNCTAPLTVIYYEIPS